MTNRLGHVRVVWINSRDTFATPRYTARFACYEQPEELGAQKPKDIVGEAELLKFLQLFNLDAENLKDGSRVLHQLGYMEIVNVVFSDERLANLGLR